MKKKLLIALTMVALVVALTGGATFALFSDEATNEGNTFAAGTLDLKVDGGEVVRTVTVNNMAPGDTTEYFKWVLKNDGSLPGKLSVSFSNIENSSANMNDPKEAALKEYFGNSYAYSNEGYLGWFLKPGKHPDVALAGLTEGVDYTIKERNDAEGWYIVEMLRETETLNSMGFSPVGWSVPSRIFSQWATGPQNPWGIPGLNGIGGKTYGTFGYLPNDVLQPGQEVQFLFRVSLDQNLRIWDGTKWIEAPDNMIQGDSASFDITFKLDQVL